MAGMCRTSAERLYWHRQVIVSPALTEFAEVQTIDREEGEAKGEGKEGDGDEAGVKVEGEEAEAVVRSRYMNAGSEYL